MSAMITMQEALETLPQRGRLEWIGLRRSRHGLVEAVETTEAIAGLGLMGDHRASRKKIDLESKRQVTLLQAEHLSAVAGLSGNEALRPEQLRRNLLVSGVNLNALKDRRFRIGLVLLEGTGFCHPCTRMEEALGPGGMNAMRGHGGITARILSGGVIRLGDAVRLEPAGERGQGLDP